MANDEPFIHNTRPVRIILARHGQTDWNKELKFQGHTDTKLTKTGELQAELLAERLSQWDFEIVYSSPLERALFTANKIARKKNLSPVIINELEEINFGSWEGKSLESLEKNHHNSFSKWRADPFFNQPEGAENWEQISNRLNKFLEIILKSGYKNIVTVSHGGIIRALFAVLLGFNPHKTWNIDASNCSMSGIEIRNGRACLAFSNDDLHIKAENIGVTLPVWNVPDF